MGGGTWSAAPQLVSADRAAGAGADLWLRPASAGDLAGVLAIEQAAFTDPWSLQAFHQLLGQQGVVFLVASTAGGDVEGYVAGWIAADEGEIATLAVAGRARGHRIGGRLLDAGVAELAARGASAVYLEVRASNAAAQRLYASRGFRHVGNRRGYYRRPVEDACVMRLDVPWHARPAGREK